MSRYGTCHRRRRSDGSLPYIQAYYRRASANTLMMKHREALRDWKLVVKKAPNDATAKLRMVECEKIIKRDAFLKAIEVEDAPSAAEGLDIENMILEAGYDGAKLEDKMTLEFIEDMIERFKNGKKLAKKYAYQIIIAVMEISKKEPTMIEHDVEEGHEITVCGDTHGRLTSPVRDNMILTPLRSILRSYEHLQACWQAVREALIPVQR
jgi:serine/threonine-protein phosphatase 5